MRSHLFWALCAVSVIQNVHVTGSPIVEKYVNVDLKDEGDERPHIIQLEVKVLPETTEKTGEETGEVPTGQPRADCIVMSDDDADIYRHFRCNLTEELPQCYKTPKCPDACTAEDGSRKEHNGPMWPEQDGQKMCECVTWHQILASPPLPPPGAVPWPPEKHCQNNGCIFPGNDTLIAPGTHVELYGEGCDCVGGPDPELMDFATLYHLKCTGVHSAEVDDDYDDESDEI